MTSFLKKYILLIALIFPVVACGQSFPAFPMSFWGSVTINGTAAPTGTIVRAYYGTVLAGQVILSESGVYGYTEPTRQKLVVGEGSGTITFTVQSSSVNSGNETGGSSAQTYTSFSSGLTVQQNLNFIVAIKSVSPPASGGGGGGGGSSGGSTSVSTTVKKGDINGDNKVDKYDFSIMMFQWGQTGSNLSADLNHDGKVDKYDFALLMSEWGK